MDLKDLLNLMWRNLRYLALGLILGAGLGIAAANIQVPVYEASTKVFVNRTRQQNNTDMLSLSDEQWLAINLQLAKSPAVLNEVSVQLGGKVEADNIQVAALPNTLIMQMQVQDGDPQRAALIGNLLVKTLIRQNEALLSERYSALEIGVSTQVDQVQAQIEALQAQISQVSETSIEEQVSQVNQQIDQLGDEISRLEQEIASSPASLSPLEQVTLSGKQAQLDQAHSLMAIYQQIRTNLVYMGKPGSGDTTLGDPRVTTLQSTLVLYQQINATLINSRESIRLARTQSSQNAMQIVSATAPKTPVRPLPMLYLLLGGFVGLALAGTAVLLIDQLDDTLKTAAQTEKLLGLPVLGFVTENKNRERNLVAAHAPHSAEVEPFRSLGASVEVIAAGISIRTLMILNAGAEDEKTTIAANLAILNAHQGKQVILVDGDFCHPYLHTLFGLPNQTGLAEIINENLGINSAYHSIDDVQGLRLIPGGARESALKEWLDASKVTQLLWELQDRSDLVIVEGPGAQTPDAQILASKMDAVLLAVRAGHTRLESARTTLKRIQLTGASIIGVVLYRASQDHENRKFILHLPQKARKGGRREAGSKLDDPTVMLS